MSHRHRRRFDEQMSDGGENDRQEAGGGDRSRFCGHAGEFVTVCVHEHVMRIRMCERRDTGENWPCCRNDGLMVIGHNFGRK